MKLFGHKRGISGVRDEVSGSFVHRGGGGLSRGARRGWGSDLEGKSKKRQVNRDS